MANWGDSLWDNIAILQETADLPTEPGPLSPTCLHCHDPYDRTDEDTNPRYYGLCLGCAEWFKVLDRQDDLVIAHETFPWHFE